MHETTLENKRVDDFRFCLQDLELVPIVIGGMGVNISTPALALEAARLGGVGHISDAMVPFVSDRMYGTSFVRNKEKQYHHLRASFDKTQVKFNLEELRLAQLRHVRTTMNQKKGSGLIFINVMEKLTMGAPDETLEVRLRAALDGGIDGITLSAGLHTKSFQMLENHPRFFNAKLGIIVSSARALKIFLRSAKRAHRLPDYIVVEGPLAGGHLGFGEDWKKYKLVDIVRDVLAFLESQDLNIPVIPAGGVFTGTDAVEFLEIGASAVQVATRFVVSQESGLPSEAKQRYFEAEEKDVLVTSLSPTGYPLRMLRSSPCLRSSVQPQCEAFGYALDGKGNCAYLRAYEDAALQKGEVPAQTKEKMCLCYQFSKFRCFTCGHYVYRLKDTTIREKDGRFHLPTAEQVFSDYQYSKNHEVALPQVH